jgi:nudix-type nucleoside diphosphatase (YffH/AdpP family)
MIVDQTNKYGGYLKVDEITYKNQKGKNVKREVMKRPNAVSALVYDTNKKVYVFVKQWRPGASSDVLEIVAGTLDHSNEDTRSAIEREILEEIGYKTDNLKLIDEGWVSPGGTTEKVSIYFAEVSEKVSEGGGLESEDEEIEIIEMTKSEMLSTRFEDLKTIIAVMWARYNHN